MRTTAKLLLMTGAALVMALPVMPAAEAAGTEYATIANFSFSPNPLKIPLGTTVEWTNTVDTPHTVTADDGSFHSAPEGLAKNAKFAHTFNEPGPVTYHCAIHPSMTGTVDVEAPSTTAQPMTTTTAPVTRTTAAPTTTTTAVSSPPTAGLAAPKPTAPKPAVSSTTRATAAPTTATTAAPTTSTTAPATTTTTLTEQTAPPAQAALDTPADESGNGSAIGLVAAIVAVVLFGGGGFWVWRRRVSAG